MSGKLLDTNAVIALQKADPDFLQFLDSDDELLIPAIVIGELYLGAYNSGRVTDNIQVIEAFVSDNVVLVCDAETGKYFGQIRFQLRVKGRPIPENDIWIAAIAVQHGLTLVTRDDHFRAVDGLIVERW
jgi:tRNA(fMet)-specific endonuclease VapC